MQMTFKAHFWSNYSKSLILTINVSRQQYEELSSLVGALQGIQYILKSRRHDLYSDKSGFVLKYLLNLFEISVVLIKSEE